MTKIILVNHGGYLDTIECLESIFKQDNADYQVFIVDNSLNNTSFKELVSWAEGTSRYEIESSFNELVQPPIIKPINYCSFNESEFYLQTNIQEQIVIIKADENNGFAAANNIVLKYIIKEELTANIWLLNNDTVLERNTLSSLVSSMQKSGKKLGMLGSMLCYYYHPERIQALGAKFNKLLIRSEHIGAGIKRTDSIDHKKISLKLDYIVGASIFLKSEFIREVGLMCEDYFLYYEELDWTLRGERFGWEIDFDSNAIVYHKEGASILGPQGSIKSLLSDVCDIRNKLVITKKFYPLLSPIAYMSLLITLVNRIRRNQFERIPVILRAAFSRSYFDKFLNNYKKKK